MDKELSAEIFKIQSIDRALRIPSVNYLWGKSTKVYGRVKSANIFTNWAFGTVENMFGAVLEKSLPVARLMEKPICNLDKTLCQGFDFVEVKLPIIKEEPQAILDRTKSLVSNRLRPAVQTFIDLKHETKQRVRIITLHTYYRVLYLRIYSWKQADKVMSTETGISILKKVDDTTECAERILNLYFPAQIHEEMIEEREGPVCCEHAKLHHTVIRLSELADKITRRLYDTLVDKLQHMYKIEIVLLFIYTLVFIEAMTLFGMILETVFMRLHECLSSLLDKKLL